MSKNSNKNHLFVTLLAGVILLVIVCGVMIFLYFNERFIWTGFRKQDSFSSILREYDAIAGVIYGTQREYDRLHHELDRLEKKAISVESWLSILKRRKHLANIHPPSEEIYRISVNNALKAYPQAQSILAIASAALVKNSAVNREIESHLRDWLPYFTDASFNTLSLSLHVLLGDFNSPQKAHVLPANLYTDGTESITVDLAVLKTLRHDFHGAASDVQIMLKGEPSLQTLRFAAEYNYDFGDLLRSAEIFSLINSTEAMSRQADALYLAGFPENAASIWSMLADLPHETSLYNLAVISEDRDTAAGFLEKLIMLDTLSNSNSRQFGIIRYSRFLNYTRALALLRGNLNFSPEDYPYIDLEICRRLSQEQNPGFQIAQTWLLLERHEINEELYKWACRLFFFHRRYDEALILLNRMEQLQVSEEWIDVYNALYSMIEGRLETAEDIFHSILSQKQDWYIFANYGLILEYMRSFTRAMEQYELASAKLQTEILQKSSYAAKIQIHIAKCFTALKRPLDARRTLEYALELDPDNLSAYLLLDKNTF
jgi:tetratricopeptide (TPR) repeat protein